MASRFLENFSLRTLVAPISEDEFRARYWEQQMLVVQRDDPGYYGDLFTLQDFDDAIACNPSYVKMANAATGKNASYQPDKAQGIEAILADMRGGGTLVLDQIQYHNPNLSLLCRLLGQEIGHRLQTNLYLTPPNGKGFTPHWDNHDVFILQVLGSKHWKIEKTRRAFPQPIDKIEDDARDLRGEVLSLTLNQGDLVYLPRGFVHAAECGEGPSLHITLGLIGFFIEDLLVAAARGAVRKNEHLRAMLPLGFHRAPEDDLVKLTRDALKEISNEEFIRAIVGEFRDDMIKRCPLDVTGQVLEHFQPKPIKIDDRFGPRRGIFYQMHINGAAARVNFGARSISFQDFFGDALDFALKTPNFAVRDLPGDIEDIERIVFVERLLQEGLIVRASAT